MYLMRSASTISSELAISRITSLQLLVNEFLYCMKIHVAIYYYIEEYHLTHRFPNFIAKSKGVLLFELNFVREAPSAINNFTTFT